MTTPVKDLKGATDSVLSALKDKGITDNEKLAAAGADPAGRKELAALCGCDVEILLSYDSFIEESQVVHWKIRYPKRHVGLYPVIGAAG